MPMWVAEICRIKTGMGTLPIAGMGVRKPAPTPLRLSKPLLLFCFFFSHLEWSGKGFSSDLLDIQNDFCSTSLLYFRQCRSGLLHTSGREVHAWATPAWDCNTPWCDATDG